jgi:hypothetical protein
MLFERTKINQITIQSEGRHFIFDGFRGVWRRLPNRSSDLFQNLLHILWKAGDILIDGFRYILFGTHMVLL